jgi:hypothetical protein
MSLKIIAGSLKILMLEEAISLWKHRLSLSILQLQQRNITLYEFRSKLITQEASGLVSWYFKYQEKQQNF